LKKMTISEIAKIANVSKSTVSRAINGSDRISDETRNKIYSIMKEYGFVPDSRARNLSSKKTNTIALILPAVSGPYYGEILNGAEEILMKNDYFALFMGCGSEESRKRYFKAIEEKRVDGAIILDWKISDKLISKADIPLVLMDTPASSENVISISIDNASGSYEMTKHLIDFHGYKDIVFATGPANSYDSEQRLAGYLNALREFGISVLKEKIMEGDFTFDSGKRIAKKIIKKLPEVVFAANDEMALGIMETFKENGIIPGKDVFMAGFDDTIWAKFIDPPLTTVKQPIKEIGRISAMKIVDSLESGKKMEAVNLKLGTQLIIRQSCGCQIKKGEV